METDSNPTRRAMTYYVENPVLIDRLFDNVAYSKCKLIFLVFGCGSKGWKPLYFSNGFVDFEFFELTFLKIFFNGFL